MLEPPPGVSNQSWSDWRWQFKSALQSKSDFEGFFNLSDEELAGFSGLDQLFRVRVTPYYAELARQSKYSSQDPIRKMLLPSGRELAPGSQQMSDPLGENQHSPVPRIIHRYSDRVLFLVTDFCSVYCRYCLRKHFTAHDQVMVRGEEYENALSYIASKKGLREVILSGGDPLTLADAPLEKILSDLRKIEHIEIIRIGTRIPVVAPQRVTKELVEMLRKYKPVFMMTHFNHPRELTAQAAEALSQLVDHGVPVFNQMVLLNGINNHPALVQALSRRLLYLRVKPYYMFQCDPSEGTDHLRTSVDESLAIQKELWGHLSGLAMPNLSLDIPGGGGKVGLVPHFELTSSPNERHYRGWDGREGKYINPPKNTSIQPSDVDEYSPEWELTK